MGDIDTTVEIKKVCIKRVNESTGLRTNTNSDGVLVSDDSVVESDVFSVESISMGSSDGDPMVPVTPHSKGEGVDYCLGLDDSPSPLAFPNEKLLDRDSQLKGGHFIERGCDSPLSLEFPSQKLIDYDSLCEDGGVIERGFDSPSPLSYPDQQLLHCDSQLKDGGVSSEDILCTPKKDIFDPFAPGQVKLNLAPYRRKYSEELKLSVARKLQFDMFSSFAAGSEDVAVSEEDMLYQSVYSSIMEAIISTQSKENGKVSCELPFDGCETPILVPRLTGVADTCPGAPVKCSNRFRWIDKEIIRKLEF